MGKRGRKPGVRAPRDPHRGANMCNSCVHNKLKYAKAINGLVYTCELSTRSLGCVDDYEPKDRHHF